ncbi:hypothetical protein TNIN_29941 [Trichonephila inaurata madagascariensis]|uniref:Uncharacterized protein n=1 Tax=Trichonephila inaurata madagascariensis TaxID=2747483 RepID=A0A8X6XN95_9ARAC|nr:hypothetical protein TNIN_29941 [Trichonephila inaurata madagascariensis]
MVNVVPPSYLLMQMMWSEFYSIPLWKHSLLTLTTQESYYPQSRDKELISTRTRESILMKRELTYRVKTARKSNRSHQNIFSRSLLSPQEH